MANKFEAKPDEIRAWGNDELLQYIVDAGPKYNELMTEAEKIMEQARPLADGLYVARGEAIQRGIPLPT